MAETLKFGMEWGSVFRKTNGEYLEYGNTAIVTGGSSGIHTFIGIPWEAIKEKLETSQTPPQVFLNIYIPNSFGKTSLGFHREITKKTTSGMPAFNRTFTSWNLQRFHNRVDVTNATIDVNDYLNTFKRIFVEGNYKGIVLYGEAGDAFTEATGRNSDEDVMFSVEIIGEWQEEPPDPEPPVGDRMSPRDETGFIGLDISSWQVINDPEKLFRNSPHYMYLRAYGSDHAGDGDNTFEERITLARQYGVPTGAYYFATPRKPPAGRTIQQEAEEEAQQFINKLHSGYGNGFYGELVPMLDVEEYRDLRSGVSGYPMASGMTAQELLDWILAFQSYFKTKTDRALGFYSNRYFMQDSTQMGLSNAQMQQLAFMPLWLAEYDRWYPNNPTQGPAKWAGWSDYNLWQYEVLQNASDYGLAPGDVDHNYCTDLALIKPPPPPTNTRITQISNTEITITFQAPNVSDYIGANVYKNGVWVAWVQKGENSVTINANTPIGEQLQINVVAHDAWGDGTWGGNTYYRMYDIDGGEAPPLPPDEQPLYTNIEVKEMLHAKRGHRNIRFRYDLLDKNDRKIRTLSNVLNGTVTMQAFASIKRTATFTIREDENEPINFLTDRIQPFVEFKMPDIWKQDTTGNRVLVEGTWISYSLGIFILSSPTKREEGDFIYRDIEAYDKGVILEEDKFIERTIFTRGTTYVDAIISILKGAGITKYNIESDDKALTSDREYEPGTPKSKPIADFLNAINYTPIWVDEYGYFTSSPYISPRDAPIDYTYDTDEFSVISQGMEEELDLYSVPNAWVAYYSSADLVDDIGGEPVTLTANYTNSNPDSPTSTVSRGRTIVDYRQIEEIANQASLEAYIERIAFEASQIFGKVKFTTAIMPFHKFQDVLFLHNPTLGIEAKYAETSWSIPLVAGGLMSHEARRVIDI